MQLQVTAASVGLRSEPNWNVGLETELLFGERFEMEYEDKGWVCGRSVLDGYEGWIMRSTHIVPAFISPTHTIDAREAIAYTKPDFKSHPRNWLSHGALCAVRDTKEDYSFVEGAGWVFTRNLRKVNSTSLDWVGEAEKYIGTSYLWGGRTASRGVDCSGLVQNALSAGGYMAPRNSGDQERILGTVVRNGSALLRGDLVFWKGHVGIMLDEKRLIHATVDKMAVVVENLDDVVLTRLEKNDPVKRIKRIG